MLIDPRHGDVEDDAASPGQRSLLAIAGSLLAEISLPKLLFAWTVLLLMPAALLGLAPLLVSAWFSTLSQKFAALTGIGTAFALLAIAAVGWIGWRPLFRLAESNFWSLNALAVQPGYAFTREALRHLAERISGKKLTARGQARLRSAISAAAGIVLSVGAVLIAILVWPGTRWTAGWNDLILLHRIVLPALANAVFLVSLFLAAASLAWGFADASMSQPVDLAAFDTAAPDVRRWRVAHLSDLHVIAEQYGFRIESGRAGPRGNDRLERIWTHLAAIHATDPLDHIIISGDMTDAGRASEWAVFLDAMALHPELAARTVMLPGNHDVNIVDRANPARLDLPFSPNMRLRQVRTLSALAAVQGDRVHVVDDGGKLAATLQEALAPHREAIVALAEHGGLRRAARLRDLFDSQFPMIVPPEAADGLGIAILNSNARTHFSFTNALGLVSVEQTHRFEAATRHYPQARWIVALHHHVVEYPIRVKKFSERIGTALINGSWFVRRLEALAGRAVVMHGHRHIDWIGVCGSSKIISAPSPVMNATDDAATHFYIHTLAAGPAGKLALLPPERVVIAGERMS
jgi:hypothetical protein